ncbi:hypothetical protein ACHAXN_005004 [Cyclotella atomus]
MVFSLLGRLAIPRTPTHAAPSALRALCTLGRSTFPAAASLPLSATCNASHPHITSALASDPFTIQLRTKVTKAKKHKRAKILERERRVARGLPAKPKPPKFIPKGRHVINAISREARNKESSSFDRAASAEMKEKISKQQQNQESIRFNFTGLQMSDRVRQLLNLSNGSQSEVVAFQKKRGMELFQLREGDTGSSAVQVVALTTRIQQMQTHLGRHKKDYSGKRGLDAMYVRRRKVLDYMERKDFESYRKVVKSLGLMR